MAASDDNDGKDGGKDGGHASTVHEQNAYDGDEGEVTDLASGNALTRLKAGQVGNRDRHGRVRKVEVVGGTRGSNERKRAEQEQRGAEVESGRRMVGEGQQVVDGERWTVGGGRRRVDGGWGRVDNGWCVMEMGHGVEVQVFVRLDVNVWCSYRCVVGDILWGL